MKKIKRYGQNFLIDKEAINLTVSSLDIQKSDNIIEIGGGDGAISQKLVTNNFNSLKIFEYDIRFSSILKNKFISYPNVSVINENILDYDYSDMNNKPWKIIGAIPYYITSPIIHKILKSVNRPNKIILIIQKEVADKLCAKESKYNYWSLITYGYEVKRIINLKPSSFSPAPKVSSSIISFDISEEQDLNLIFDYGFEKWSKFLHHLFRNPNKMINKTFKKDILSKLNINETLRPMHLSKSQIIKLYKFTTLNYNEDELKND